MPGIQLQRNIIYGSVLSRRLGRSLGINLMPVDCKLCSFDCIYCQYGCTDILTNEPSLSLLPSVDEVCWELERAFRKPRTIEFITFSGNGESTLHPQFPELVHAVKALRDKLRPEAKLALLSNSSTVNMPDIQSTLDLIDAPMMKLDAGDEQTFKVINRPVSGIVFSDIVKGLKTRAQLMLQTMFVDGEVSNIRGEAYQELINLIKDLQPTLVHIYSTERPTAEIGVQQVNPKKLLQIGEEITKRGINVEVFYRT